jgi:hypothetical protein
MSSRKQWKTKCTTCGRLARDHMGPVGKKCQRSPVKLDMDDEDLSYAHSDHGSDKSGVLHELADQMSQLAISMQSMQDELIDVKKEIRGANTSDAGAGLASHRIASDYLSAGSGAHTATTEANICLPSGAKVSNKTLLQTRTGEYINLADYAPCLEPTLTTETSLVDGELVFRPKRNVKNIDSFLLWSMAWRGYEEVLVNHNPALYPQLVSYRVFIQTCSAKFWWPAVYSYDVRNRGKHSMDKTFDFNCIDNDIYVTTMDASTARQNIRNCSRCKSIWHVIKDCPFTEDGAVAQSPRQAPPTAKPTQPTRMPTQQNQSAQVCFNWNAGRCFGPCNRRHVCEGCGGPDPRPRCPSCTQGNSSFGKQRPAGPSVSAPVFTPAGGNQTQQGRVA